MPEGLELESRRRIYDFLTANPGVHLRKIGQVLGMSTGMLSYHLGYLERNGILKSEEDGHRKRYFIARAFVEAQRRILAVLRQDVPRKIVLELLFFGERTFAELQTSDGSARACSRSRTSRRSGNFSWRTVRASKMTRWTGSRTCGRKSEPDVAGRAARVLRLIRAIPRTFTPTS